MPQQTTAKLSIRDVEKRFRIRKKGQSHEFLALGGVDLEIADH